MEKRLTLFGMERRDLVVVQSNIAVIIPLVEEVGMMKQLLLILIDFHKKFTQFGRSSQFILVVINLMMYQELMLRSMMVQMERNFVELIFLKIKTILAMEILWLISPEPAVNGF